MKVKTPFVNVGSDWYIVITDINGDDYE